MEHVHAQLGRPPLPETVRRAYDLRFRLSGKEKRRLMDAADLVRKPLSEFVRAAALREAERVEDVTTTIRQQ